MELYKKFLIIALTVLLGFYVIYFLFVVLINGSCAGGPCGTYWSSSILLIAFISIPLWFYNQELRKTP